MKTVRIAFFGYLLTAVGPAAAQEATGLTPGTTVRVSAPAHGWYRRRAEVTAVTGDTVVLRAEYRSLRHGEPVQTELIGRLPVADIARLEVLAGRRSSAGKGLVTGALIGSLAGAGLGAAWWLSTDEDDWIGCTAGCIATGGVGGALMGSVIGVVIGALGHSDVWRPVHLTPGGVSRVPGTTRLFEFAVAF